MSKSKYQAAIKRAKALGYRLRIRGNSFEFNRLDGSAEKDGSLGMGGSPLDDLAEVLDIIEATGGLPSPCGDHVPVLSKTANKLFRVVVIDPEHRTVEIVKTASSGYFPRDSDDEIGVSLCNFSEDKTLRVNGWLQNEWSLLGRKQPVYAFLLCGHPEPFLGRMCILGEQNKKRKDVDTLISVENLRDKIEWLGLVMPRIAMDIRTGMPKRRENGAPKMTYSKVSSKILTA
jgi:hypothetical protein